jgi:hypothetical protein
LSSQLAITSCQLQRSKSSLVMTMSANSIGSSSQEKNAT